MIKGERAKKVTKRSADLFVTFFCRFAPRTASSSLMPLYLALPAVGLRRWHRSSSPQRATARRGPHGTLRKTRGVFARRVSLRKILMRGTPAGGTGGAGGSGTRPYGVNGGFSIDGVGEGSKPSRFGISAERRNLFVGRIFGPLRPAALGHPSQGRGIFCVLLGVRWGGWGRGVTRGRWRRCRGSVWPR